MTFVLLDRHFRDLSEKELEDPELLASFNDWRYAAPQGWGELLALPRVLLIAEAGSGKTAEMQAQAQRLSTDGKAAFFLPIESLDQTPLRELLSPEDQKRFEAWHRGEGEEAWFFLDAVDELKLTQGKLDRALIRFAHAVDGRLSDIHVVLSCRPYDWRREVDMEIFRKRLPVPPRTIEVPDAEEAFLAPLTDSGKKAAKAERTEEVKRNQTKIVMILPLSHHQIEAFITAQGVKNPKALLREISDHEAWTFARRPLDLIELIAYWNQNGHLGTRAQQHEQNITAKLAESPERPGQDVLSDAKAREGAQRLALALTLTRTRTFRVPESASTSGDEAGVLDPGTILGDWTAEERHSLLRRALFDPATYGRVRFHHRSVQEYLAAQYLKCLRSKGMTIATLNRLLFAEFYGEKLVLPSMQAIAAWLALTDDNVRQTLLARAPEILLTQGDPESLALADRIRIIRAFAQQYGEGGWRGVRIPLEEVRRLADPGLAETIRQLWPNYNNQPDVGTLLIDLIWQAKITSLMDLVETKALDDSADDHQRVMAVRALLACGAIEPVRRLTELILANPGSLKSGAIHGLIPDLFPVTLSVQELLALVERVPELDRTVGGFSWNMRLIAERLDPGGETARLLRDGIAHMIWNGRNATQEFHQIRGCYNFLSPALGILCLAQVKDHEPDVGLARAIAIANRFQPADGVSGSEIAPRLRKVGASHEVWRSTLFWADVDLMDGLVTAQNESMRLFIVEHDGLVPNFMESDWPWLLAGLNNVVDLSRRPLALQALIDIWRALGRPGDKLSELRDATSNNNALEETVELAARPYTPDPQWEEHRLRHAARQLQHSQDEDKRLAGWKEWRQKVLADPDTYFDAKHRFDTLYNLYVWQSRITDSNPRYNVWDSGRIADAFTPEIAARARAALGVYWRQAELPLLWSERDEEKTGTIYYTWIIGLCGVALEAQDPNWVKTLGVDEVKRATVYATIEINGLPPFLGDLAKAWGSTVVAVLGPELERQLYRAEGTVHLPLLQDIGHANIDLKRLVAPILLKALEQWPSSGPQDAIDALFLHLDTIFRAVAEAGTAAERTQAAQVAATRYGVEATDGLRLAWLRGLLLLDPRKTADLVLETISELPRGDQNGINLIVKVFGERAGGSMMIEDVGDRARMLGRLVRAIYGLVHPADDAVHDGVFEPDSRDNAERARESLIAQLLNTPGPVAQAEIHAIADTTNGVPFPDRLKLLARQRAAQDAEFQAFTPEAVSQLEHRYESPPGDRDGLFGVIVDRLADLRDHLANSDFSDRALLAGISEEEIMQQTMATRLHQTANEMYRLTRESEVIDRKRTDLHIAAITGPAKAVIEIKLAENWAFSQLEKAIINQLVGQYLRDKDRKAGILLLTYGGTRKQYWVDRSTNAHLSFTALIEHLRTVARNCEQNEQGAIRLAVMGLDLRPTRGGQ